MAKKRSGNPGQDRLREGLDALEKGRNAEGWVAREALSVGPDCTVEDVVEELHRVSHEYLRSGLTGRAQKVRIAVAAANVLLREAKDGDEEPVTEEAGG